MAIKYKSARGRIFYIVTGKNIIYTVTQIRFKWTIKTVLRMLVFADMFFIHPCLLGRFVQFEVQLTFVCVRSTDLQHQLHSLSLLSQERHWVINSSQAFEKTMERRQNYTSRETAINNRAAGKVFI